MWNQNEIKELTYIAKQLNEILALTHQLRIVFDTEAATVDVYNRTTNGIGAYSLLTINVADDSARAFLNDVMDGINGL